MIIEHVPDNTQANLDRLVAEGKVTKQGDTYYVHPYHREEYSPMSPPLDATKPENGFRHQPKSAGGMCCAWTSVGGHEPDCPTRKGEMPKWTCALCGRENRSVGTRCMECGDPGEDLRKRSDFDPVNKPEHYTSHPSGVECVAITEHMSCMIGCAIKYLWRHGLKAGADADLDLRKAIWCIERERQRLALQKASNGK